MADLINVYDPTFWAQESLLNLFPQLRVGSLVYREFEDQISQQGDTVNTRLPNQFTAADVTPDTFSSVKPTADNVAIVMDQWKHVTFEIGDKEASLSLKDLTNEFIYPATFAIANEIEGALMGLYKDVYNTTGAAGTTPGTVAALGTDIREKFDTLMIPDNQRVVILGPKAQNKFNQVFYQDYVSGSAEQQTTGNLRPKFGMGYVDSNQLPRHVNGTAWTGATPVIASAPGYPAATLAAGGLPGTSTINISGLAVDGVINKGDIFSLDHGGAIGVSTYTVTAENTASGAGLATGVVISPGLRAAVVNLQVITSIATHDVNLAFHRQAFALASRPMKVPTAPGASVAVQNFSGLGLRAAIWYEPKDYRTYVRLDILFGVKTLDPRKAIRVLG